MDGDAQVAGGALQVALHGLTSENDGEAVDVKPLVGIRKCVKVGVTGLNKETIGHRDEGGWLLGLSGRWASGGGICIPLSTLTA